jgi:aerobic-type carbon monoxide dehydrogenase small subunit (CoxS/CutS family)
VDVLSDFLREDLELTGVRVTCEHGVRGACTVMLDDRTPRP